MRISSPTIRRTAREPRQPLQNHVLLHRRDEMSGSAKGGIALAIIVLIIFAVFVFILIWTRVANGRARNPKYLPGDGFIPRTKHFLSWMHLRKKSRGDYSANLQPATTNSPRLQRERNSATNEPDIERELSDVRPNPSSNLSRSDSAINNDRNPTNTIDRNTSIRSIMTLPAYSSSVRANEQLLAREGERGGIDIVLEAPETFDEEEERRNEEMESLYQIRRARRDEQAEREDRRRQRREARARGDYTTLHRLQMESRARAENALEEVTLSSQLIAEHQARTASRDRRVSAVAYGDLGVARHDGSRIRANSTDSDVRPLLDSAASISGVSRPVSVRTLATLNTIPAHHRGRSASSVLSISTNASQEDLSAPFPPFAPRTMSSSSLHRISTPTPTTSDFEIVNLSTSRSRSPSGSFIGSDVGDLAIPAVDPPGYDGGWEDAPAYESPVRSRAPQLPELRLPTGDLGVGGSAGDVPDIRVEGASPGPSTPVGRER